MMVTLRSACGAATSASTSRKLPEELGYLHRRDASSADEPGEPADDEGDREVQCCTLNPTISEVRPPLSTRDR